MHRSTLKQLGMLRRGDRIHIQGSIPPGVRQEEGIIAVKVCNFCYWLLHLIQQLNVTDFISLWYNRLPWLWFWCGKTQPLILWELSQRKDSTWTLPKGNLKPKEKEAGQKVSRNLVPGWMVSDLSLFPRNVLLGVLILLCINCISFRTNSLLNPSSLHMSVMCHCCHQPHFHIYNPLPASGQQEKDLFSCTFMLHFLPKKTILNYLCPICWWVKSVYFRFHSMEWLKWIGCTVRKPSSMRSLQCFPGTHM